MCRHNSLPGWMIARSSSSSLLLTRSRVRLSTLVCPAWNKSRSSMPLNMGQGIWYKQWKVRRDCLESHQTFPRGFSDFRIKTVNIIRPRLAPRVDTEHISVLLQWSLTVLNPDFTGVIPKCGGIYSQGPYHTKLHHTLPQTWGSIIFPTKIVLHTLPLHTSPYMPHQLCGLMPGSLIFCDGCQSWNTIVLYSALNPSNNEESGLHFGAVFQLILSYLWLNIKYLLGNLQNLKICQNLRLDLD